jgi:membrane protein YdbS with pleckstrin-like domain
MRASRMVLTVPAIHSCSRNRFLHEHASPLVLANSKASPQRVDIRMSSQPTSNAQETVVWSGTPSQKTNLGIFLLCAIVAVAILYAAVALRAHSSAHDIYALLLLPIAVAIWHWLMTRSRVYTLTDQRLKIQRGVLTHVTDNVELYRVKDSHFTQTFMQRMLGIGTILLRTTQDNSPQVVLDGMNDPSTLWERIRALVEARRDAKGVREIDMNAEPGPH